MTGKASLRNSARCLRPWFQNHGQGDAGTAQLLNGPIAFPVGLGGGRFVRFDHHKFRGGGKGLLNGFQQFGESAVAFEQTLGAPGQRAVRRHLGHRCVGKNNDGNRRQARVGVHVFEHVGSADLGQHQVQKDQIGRALGKNIEGRLSVLRALEVKPFALQTFLIHGLGNRVVLNKENGFNTYHGSNLQFTALTLRRAAQLDSPRMTRRSYNSQPACCAMKKHHSCQKLHVFYANLAGNSRSREQFEKSDGGISVRRKHCQFRDFHRFSIMHPSRHGRC
jgi:hypothetical protein